MKTAMTRKMTSLTKQFPQVWMKDGEEFSGRHVNTIWTGEGSEVDGDYAFSSYGFHDTMGVHPKLAKALDKLGLYAEFYDGGTVFIYQQ
jgi:hypothetical protein